MIEFPLPFTSQQPSFAFNQSVALKRTKDALQKLRKKKPEMLRSNIEKLAQNINVPSLRFLPVLP